MRIAITGATGLLGRNLLFEILKQNMKDLNNLEIFVFSRPKDLFSATARIEDIILNDGVEYIEVSSGHYPEIFRTLTPIVFDLESENLNFSAIDFEKLASKPIDLFFHVAAYTDFRSGQAVENKLIETNIKGTQRICDLCKKLKVKEIVYIGSAYSCGDKTGKIPPDYIHKGSRFRNPYERTKLEAEVFFRNFVSTNNIKHKIFRPSTICGRLIENPIGRTNKYDVFYSWVAFFLRQKIKMLNSTENIFSTTVDMPIRLHFNPRGGLNIVPVDYCAKVIYNICINNDTDNSYYLANPTSTPNQIYGDATFEMLNINKFSYVTEEPADKNPIESLYYKTVGKIFTPYGVSDPIIFDVSNLSGFAKRTNIKCPVIDKAAFKTLLEYAKQDLFGIPVDKLNKLL